MHHVRTARARRHSRCVGMMRLHGACRCRARAFCRATSPRTRPRRKCASCWAACQSTCVLRAPSVGVPQLSALASQSTHVSRARGGWPRGRLAGGWHTPSTRKLHLHDEHRRAHVRPCSAKGKRRGRKAKGGSGTKKLRHLSFLCFLPLARFWRATRRRQLRRTSRPKARARLQQLLIRSHAVRQVAVTQ